MTSIYHDPGAPFNHLSLISGHFGQKTSETWLALLTDPSHGFTNLYALGTIAPTPTFIDNLSMYYFFSTRFSYSATNIEHRNIELRRRIPSPPRRHRPPSSPPRGHASLRAAGFSYKNASYLRRRKDDSCGAEETRMLLCYRL